MKIQVTHSTKILTRQMSQENSFKLCRNVFLRGFTMSKFLTDFSDLTKYAAESNFK